MIAFVRKIEINLLRIFNPLILNQQRNIIYGPLYLEPIRDKTDLEKELSVDDPRRFQPIKAAKNDEHSFCTYDDLTRKFTNLYLRKGDRDLARHIIFKTYENLKLIQFEKYHKAKTNFEKESIELSPKRILAKAVNNCKPLLKIQRSKKGGVVYQVPIPVEPHIQIFMAMKWIIESAVEKDAKTRIWDSLSYELLDAMNNEGKSVRKKQELHRICEANRAYAHFRW